MEIRKMTCPKCGGTVKMDGNLAGGVCPSCGMQFGLGSQAPLTVPEAQPAVSAPALCPDDYRPGAPMARGRLSPADEQRERARREASERAVKEANRVAKEESLAVKDPAQISLIGGRLKAAFRAINAKQWMRAEAILNDILKYEPDNEEALRGKRLVAAHKTDLPEETAAQESAPLPVQPVVEQQPEPDTAAANAAVAAAAITPVLVPKTEEGRRAESEIAVTDRRMAARLSDSIDRMRIQKLLKKSNRALSNRNWKKADAYADAVLRVDPESAYAYRNKLLAELKLREERQLGEYEGTLADHRYFLLALNYSTGALSRRLLNYVDPATRSALMFERSLAFREMERTRAADEVVDRRIAEITASLPANYNDEEAEKDRNERISKILDRADAYREEQEWDKAEELYRSALAIDGECADAYLGLLLVSLNLNQEKKLAHCKEPYGTDANFLLAMHYGSRVMRRRLERYLASSGQLPTGSSSNMIILQAPPAAPVSNASATELEEFRTDVNRRFDGIERLLATGNAVETGRLSPEEITIRLDAAERDVYLTRIALAELAKENSLDAVERRAELLARLHAKEEEAARLRAALLDVEAAGYHNDYYSTELCSTERKLRPLFHRARKLHKRRKFLRADTVYREILKLDPTNGDAYIGRLLCDLGIRKVKGLYKSPRSFSSDEFYALALRFSTPDVGRTLTRAAEKVDRDYGVRRAKSDEKLTRSDKKRVDELRVSRRDALIHDAERRTQASRVNGTHLRAKAEDEALSNAQRYVRRGKFAKARAILDDLLLRSPDFAGAYLARLLCACSCRKTSQLKNLRVSFSENPDYVLACHFGKRKTRRRLEKYAAIADRRADKEGYRTDAEWAQIRDTELTENRSEQNAIYRISGDHAEQRRVRQDAFAVKTAANAGHKAGKTGSEHKKLLRKGYKSLKRKKWLRACEYFERIRNDDAADCRAYVGLLLASLGLREERDLARTKTAFSENRYYQLALCCADAPTAERLRDYAARADHRSGGTEESFPATTYTDLARRRENVQLRRINDLEKKNYDLETELAKTGERQSSGATYVDGDDDADYYVHEGGRFAALKVALFLLGALIAVAAVGAAAYFLMRYTGALKS